MPLLSLPVRGTVLKHGENGWAETDISFDCMGLHPPWPHPHSPSSLASCEAYSLVYLLQTVCGKVPWKFGKARS